MKKRVALIIISGLMLACLASCGNKKDKGDVSGNGASDTTVSTSVQAPSGESVDLSSFDLSVYEKKYVTDVFANENHRNAMFCIVDKFGDDYDVNRYYMVDAYGNGYVNLDGTNRPAYKINNENEYSVLVSTDTPGKISVLTSDESGISDDALWKYKDEQYAKTRIHDFFLASKTKEADGEIKNIVVVDMAGRFSDFVIPIAMYNDTIEKGITLAKLAGYFCNTEMVTWNLGDRGTAAATVMEGVTSKSLSQMGIAVSDIGFHYNVDINNIVYAGTLTNGIDVYAFDSNINLSGEEGFFRETAEEFEAAGYEKYEGKGTLEGYTLMLLKGEYDAFAIAVIDSTNKKVSEVGMMSNWSDTTYDKAYYSFEFPLINGESLGGYFTIDEATKSIYAVTPENYYDAEFMSSANAAEGESASNTAIENARYLVLFKGSNFEEDVVIDGLTEVLECDMKEAELLAKLDLAVINVFATKEEAEDLIDSLAACEIKAECIPTAVDFDIANLYRVDAVFNLPERGTVATGVPFLGTFKVGDEVHVIKKDGTVLASKIKEIEIFREMLEETRPGTNCGLGLEDLTSDQIEKGDIIVGVVVQ